MIKIYMSPSCASCRKVKSWFEKEKIPYTEVNILRHELTEEDLKDMLMKSLNGTDDIISTRSKVIKEQNVDIDSMSIKSLLQFILANPSILKRPIIVDDEKIQVGYNADEIEIFERAKKVASDMCKDGVCPNYSTCDHHFDDLRSEIEKANTKSHTEVCGDGNSLC